MRIIFFVGQCNHLVNTRWSFVKSELVISVNSRRCAWIVSRIRKIRGAWHVHYSLLNESTPKLTTYLSYTPPLIYHHPNPLPPHPASLSSLCDTVRGCYEQENPYGLTIPQWYRVSCSAHSKSVFQIASFQF